MNRTLLAVAAITLPACFGSGDDEPIHAAVHGFGCRSLSELETIEARVADFRERRDRESIGYDQARSMIIESFAVQDTYFTKGSCLMLFTGEELVITGKADGGLHSWNVSRSDGSQLWTHTESYRL